jgi:transglutaminase-like putative cysteine protease
MFSVAAMQDKLPDRGHYEFQAFVPELEVLVEFGVECLGRETIAVNGEQVEALKVAYGAEAIGLHMSSWLGPGGDLIRQAVPEMMDLVLEKVSEEEALAIATPFTLSDNIPVSQRIGDAKRLTYVRLKANSSGLPAAELIPQTHLQHVAPLEGRGAEITVKAETEEGLEGHSLPFKGSELEEFLASTDIIQSADPAIAAKAREIIGDETDAWAAAKKLVNWVYRKMTKVDHDPRPITASECLASMKGDCSEHATLLCALTRAVGIPSKFVTGLVYLTKPATNDGGYFYHAWNEVYVGRWVGVDPTWGECTLDAGHLVLASGSLNGESFARTNLAAVRSMGVLSLDVLEHRTKDAG